MSNDLRSLNSLEDIEFAVKRIEELEDKLEKAERALDFADHMHRTVKGWQDYGNTPFSSIRSSMNAYENVRAALAELTGETDDRVQS